MYALLIAQDADEAAVLSLVLQRAGLAVTTARDLERAMQSWPERPVDLILLALPNSDPLALVRRVRTQPEVPLVVVVNPVEEGVHRDLLEAGADLVIPRPYDPNCPIRRQIVPTSAELVPFESEMVDSLSEDAHSPVPGLVHRYPDRVLMLVTTQCASYCRFCTRSRIVGDPHAQFSPADYERQLSYIAATPQIRDVLLSGGDPLILPQRVLEKLLQRLRAIPHVEIVRIGTRVPVFLPQRINAELAGMLRQYHPLWMNIHFNHPKELAPEVEAALARLADAGIPLGSQTVLMAGINDCPNVMQDLVHQLVRNRVRPYYLYQCDLVHGAGHFRTPVSKGIEIIEALRGHTSGYAVPTHVIDAPGGGGKIPVMPNYVLSQAPGRVVVRNYEGFISTYTEPETYERHDPATCPSCRRHRLKADEQGQAGVAALLNGEQMAIKPEGFDTLHQRLTHVEGQPIKAEVTGANGKINGRTDINQRRHTRSIVGP